jgi:hypothetical protein
VAVCCNLTAPNGTCPMTRRPHLAGLQLTNCSDSLKGLKKRLGVERARRVEKTRRLIGYSALFAHCEFNEHACEILYVSVPIRFRGYRYEMLEEIPFEVTARVSLFARMCGT